MEFKDLVRNRRSIRQYQSLSVREGTIHELLEIIGLSVSAINLQPWKIKVVSDQAVKDKLFEAAFRQSQVKTCSHLLVLCADVDYPAIVDKAERAMAAAGVPDAARQGLREMATNMLNGMTPEQQLQWSREQVFIALGNAVNGAYSLGLGACPMTVFQADEFARILELPPTVAPTVLVSVGYSAEDGSPKLRHPVSEIIL
ncbi:MAG: nitroreductase family protein [Thermoleophilia bacterium]|nr:nitroreductase family protein [Thermoleophilia bacterium]